MVFSRMAGPVHRKRRIIQGPTKNELKVSRAERAAIEKTRAGTLQDRFPQARRLQVQWRMETNSGAVLENVRREVRPDEAMLFDVSCQGGCGNGLFLLGQAVEALLQSNQESREGMVLCQGVSYNDPKQPCGTKLYFGVHAEYA